MPGVVSEPVVGDVGARGFSRRANSHCVPWSAVLASAWLVAACGSDVPAPATKPAPAAPAAPAAAEDEPDPEVVAVQQQMPRAVTVGAATAPVELRFDLATAPRPGEPFTLELAVLPQSALLSLRAAITGSDGLEVVSPAEGLAFERLQAGSVHRFTITAVSARPGTRVVNVAMRLELPTGPANRTFGVPVVVGSPSGA
ncbi:MAG: hypothetical protein ACK53C_04480 [Pseudomonadota bacterium]